jgi:hypothetical protein
MIIMFKTDAQNMIKLQGWIHFKGELLPSKWKIFLVVEFIRFEDLFLLARNLRLIGVEWRLAWCEIMEKRIVAWFMLDWLWEAKFKDFAVIAKWWAGYCNCIQRPFRAYCNCIQGFSGADCIFFPYIYEKLKVRTFIKIATILLK